MSPVEIVLIIIGIILIAISCIVVDKSQKNVKFANQKITVDELLSSDDLEKWKEKLKETFVERSEETIVQTEDELSKISNEKIMAINEFSDQILEKIEHNHEEVVFLYHMLGDKEKELKAVVNEINSSKKKIQEKVERKKEISTITTRAITPASDNPVLKQNNKKSDKNNKLSNESTEMPEINSLSTNNNKQILSLYSQGKSVVEISKLLDLGQGEVKLVIDLFKGKK